MAIVKGTGKNDTLNDPGDVTNGYDNTILGYGGDDTIYINKGNDTVEGGDGNDKIYASWSEDIEIGRDQGDFGNLVAVRGETYSDTLDGNDGNDLISLAAGHSFADGGEGYDLVTTAPVTGQVHFHNSSYFPVQFDASYDRSAKAVIDLKRGTILYSGYSTSVDIFHYDPPGSGNRVDDITIAEANIGAMDHTIRNFEGAQGAPGRSDIIRGTNRTDIVEILAPGKGFISARYTFNDTVDGRGGIDVVSYAGEIGGVDVNLARGIAKGIKQTFGTEDANVYRDKIMNIEGALGGSGDDILRGTDDDNWFSGSGGDDTIAGGKGFDIVTYTLGEFGNKVGTGAAGFPWASNGTRGIKADMATGIVRDDFGAKDRLTGIEGLFGSVNDDAINGSAAGNRIWGGAGDDEINGLGGDDVLQGGDGTDTIDGGEGFDTLDYSTSFPVGGLGVNVTLKNHTARDPFGTSDTVRNIEKVIGTALRDLIKGDNHANVIIGGDGRDNLGGLGGKDTLYGGDQKDSLGGGDGNDTLYGGSGDDQIFGGEGRDTIYGGDDDDTLFGEEGADTVYGGDGKDQIRDDKIETGIQRLMLDTLDLLETGAAPPARLSVRANLLDGGGKDDILLGVGHLIGGTGDDMLKGVGLLDGGKGADHLETDQTLVAASGAFASNSILIGGAGNDTLIGGNAWYGYAGSGVHANLRAGTVRVGPGDTDTVQDVSLFLTRFDDVVALGDYSTGVHTFDGNDRLFGKDLDGDDYYLITGSGKDRVDITMSTDSGILTLETGADADRVTVSAPRNFHIETGNGNDTVNLTSFIPAYSTGENFNRILNTGTGSDTLTVYANVADISAGAGNDSIRVDYAAHSTIKGGSGNDTIVLDDTPQSDIWGGAGKDRFVFISEAPYQVSIQDYDAANEVLDLRQMLPATVATFQDFLAITQQTATGLTIMLNGEQAITLVDVAAADLHAGLILL